MCVPVALGLGGGEDHGLKRDRVSAVELIGPNCLEELEGLLDHGRVRLSPGGQEGERDQARRARFWPARSASVQEPSALCRSLRNRTPVANGPFDFFAGHAAQAAALITDEQRRHRQDDETDPPERLPRAEHRSSPHDRYGGAWLSLWPTAAGRLHTQPILAFVE